MTSSGAPVIAGAFGGGHVIIIVVIVLLVGRVGYAVSKSRGRQRTVVDDASEIRSRRSATNADSPADARVPIVTGNVVTDPILDIRNLTVTYGSKKAVDGITLQIARSEIFGLLGPNGAGKTSTLSAIEGAVTQRRLEPAKESWASHERLGFFDVRVEQAAGETSVPPADADRFEHPSDDEEEEFAPGSPRERCPCYDVRNPL